VREAAVGPYGPGVSSSAEPENPNPARLSRRQSLLAEPQRAEPSRADELQERRVVAFGDAFRHAACDNGIEDYEPREIGQQGGQ
jgi:hypothetical protein